MKRERAREVMRTLRDDDKANEAAARKERSR